MVNLESMVKVDWSNQRVLTTAQLAACYNCSTKNIHDNFARTKEHFIEGVHYFKLEGEQLKQFRLYADQIGLDVSPNTPTMCLWTAAGILLHSRLLDTPEAWILFGEVGSKITTPLLEEILFMLASEPVAERESNVYALEMNNATVKIGVSNCVERRIKEVEYNTGLEVVQYYQTQNLPRAKAYQLETELHKIFAAQQVEGEFFSVTFEEAVFEIKKYFTLEQPEHLDDARLKLLVELCAVPLDCPEKLLLFKETANLLLGRSLF